MSHFGIILYHLQTHRDIHVVIFGKKKKRTVTFVLSTFQKSLSLLCQRSLIFFKYVQQVKKFTCCQVVCDRPAPSTEYMVIMRELKYIFLGTLTCRQCRTGYNFMCNVLFKICILAHGIAHKPILILHLINHKFATTFIQYIQFFTDVF